MRVASSSTVAAPAARPVSVKEPSVAVIARWGGVVLDLISTSGTGCPERASFTWPVSVRVVAAGACAAAGGAPAIDWSETVVVKRSEIAALRSFMTPFLKKIGPRPGRAAARRKGSSVPVSLRRYDPDQVIRV